MSHEEVTLHKEDSHHDEDKSVGYINTFLPFYYIENNHLGMFLFSNPLIEFIHCFSAIAVQKGDWRLNKRTWLIKLRKRKMMTQQEVASKAFIERSYYAQIENGIRKPSSEVTVKLSEVLDFHASSFNLEENPFSIALKNAPVVLAHCDTLLRYTWIFNTPDLVPDEHIGKTDIELDNNEGNRALMRLKQDVLVEKAPINRVVSIPLKTGTVSYNVYAHPLLNEEGIIIGVATASTEISTSKQRDEQNDHT